MGIRRLIVPVALMLAFTAASASAAQRARGGERRVPGAGARSQAPSRGAGRVAVPRSYGPRAETRGRTGVSPRVYAAPRVYVAPRASRPVYRGYNTYAYRSYPRYYYSRPYYSFRPRVSIGFGLWVGYPVPYPVYTPYPYPYPSTYPYLDPYAYPGGYPPAAAPYPPSQYPTSSYPAPSYPSQPNTVSPTAVGGVSFDITPPNALIYVDGQYVGAVQDFTASTQPLSLAPGRHHVELQADGFIPMGFDVDIVAGQIIPYRGDLQRD
jgi:hypothetical protein